LRRVDKNEALKITNDEWEILKKYKLNDDEIDTLKKYDFWFNEKDFLEIGLNDDSTLSSQKLAIRIVILIALIEHYMGKKKDKKQEKTYGPSLVKDFFFQLNTEEKFALNWIIEVRNPTPVEIVNQLEQRPEEYNKWWMEEKNRIREYKRSLIEKLISNEEKFISDEFKNRIQYLYDLRSQTVHRGEIVYILEHRHPFLKKSKWVDLLPYKKRKEEIILYFNEEEIGKPFEEILEDLFFISFFRNKKIFSENEFFENSFRKSFKRMLENIPKYNHDLLPLSLRKRLELYVQNINNLKTC
jgi:hypothetical protein